MSESQSSNVTAVFSKFVGQLETESDLRDEIRNTVKDVDRLARELVVGLSEIHMSQAADRLAEIVSAANERFGKVRTSMQLLISKVPLEQYYVFHEHWRYTMHKLAFSAAMIIYLQHQRLATLDEVATTMGVKSDNKLGFHLDLEDYLFGLLQLASELSRYCVNRVTAGDYASPLKIFAFIGELGGGFRLLNLKNNDLRRRFDSLKYDEKKVEEVIYDLSVRGMLHKNESASQLKEPGTFHVISEKTRLTSDFSDPTSMQE